MFKSQPMWQSSKSNSDNVKITSTISNKSCHYMTGKITTTFPLNFYHNSNASLEAKTQKLFNPKMQFHNKYRCGTIAKRSHK